jgi:hypothetical protein
MEPEFLFPVPEGELNGTASFPCGDRNFPNFDLTGQECPVSRGHLGHWDVFPLFNRLAGHFCPVCDFRFNSTPTIRTELISVTALPSDRIHCTGFFVKIGRAEMEKTARYATSRDVVNPSLRVPAFFSNSVL